MTGEVWAVPGYKMGFPKAPKRRVSGRLKLQIKPPVTNKEEEKDPREDFVGAADLSSSLEFAFPRGFVVDSASRDVTDRQEKNALHWLEERDKKPGDCRGCRKNMASVTIWRARQLIKHVCAFLKERSQNHATVVVGHQRDGTITVNFTSGDRELATIVHPDYFELGRYLEGVFVSGSEFRSELPLPNDCLSWLSKE